MSRHVWSVLCQQLILDQLTNSVSYIQALEGFTVTQLPFTVPQLSVGSLYERSGSETSILGRIRILAPNGSVVHAVELAQGIYGEHRRMRMNSVIGGFAIAQPGAHVVVVEQRRGTDWVEEARLPLDVSVASVEQIV